MANYIVTIVLSVVIATKIMALIQFLMKKRSSKILHFWIPTDKLEVLRDVSKENQQKMTIIICLSLMLDIGIVTVMIITLPKDESTLTLLLSIGFYLNSVFLEKYTQSIAESGRV
ncbi:hypothetical protein [Desemzia sp. FAM 23991]|uniref:hypothetical protein n=1 Tax=unclassified Desemzia TaxID=2685243 RepID=UPI003889B85E